MSTIKFNKINETLKLWENYNKLAEFLELCHKSLKSKPYTAAIGSQLEGFKSLRKLVRPIPYYNVLRKALERKNTFENLGYLPTVPTVLRKRSLSIVEILFSIDTQKLFLFPWFLSHWLRQKRVCHIDCLDKIQPVVPTTENYLRFLPFDDFLLSLPEPIFSNKEGAISENPFKLFFIHREGGKVFILGLREDIDENLKELESFNSEVSFNNLKKKKIIEMQDRTRHINRQDSKLFYINWIVDIETGEKVFCKNFEMTSASWDREQSYVSDVREVEKDNRMNVVEMVFWLNGLCKLFATSAKSEYEFISNPTSYKPKVSKGKHTCPVEPEMEWFEVPHSSTVYLTMEDKEHENQMISRIGSSKRPHDRIHHTRTYRDSLGNIKHQVFIDDLKIHKNRTDDSKQSDGSVKKVK